MNENEFNKKFDESYEEKKPDFENHINIAVIGKVSSGKSSLINAILGRERSDPLAEVGAISGVTTKVTAYRLDKQVLIVDSPGLNDVRQENSIETKNFINSIDLGLFVVTESADDSQKANFDDLKKSCQEVFVVLNKIDMWDEFDQSEYDSVLNQWKSVLGVSKIYGTCSKGYNPKFRPDAPMDLRGINELKRDIFSFLDKDGKSLLLARHLKNKETYALRIIALALASVAVEAFIPGSAAYITSTQILAITSLNYLYTGEVLSKSNALSLLPTFAGESIGMTVFLWTKSVLPPTGIIDAAAAVVAVTITFAMLSAVKWVLLKGYNLDQKDMLGEAFKEFKTIGIDLKNISLSDFDFNNIDAIIELVSKLIDKKA